MKKMKGMPFRTSRASFEARSAIAAIFLALTGLVFAQGPASEPGSSPPQGIQKVSLADLDLYWVRATLWQPDRSAVIISDSIKDRVIALDLSARDAAAVPGKTPSWWLVPELSPIYVAKASTNGYIQIPQGENGPEGIQWFRRDLSRRGLAPVKSSPISGNGDVLYLHNWTVAGAGDLVFAYGVLNSGIESDPYKLGFFTFRLQPPAHSFYPPLKGNFIHSFVKYDYYTFGAPFVVNMGYDVYYLAMGLRPILYFYDTRGEGVLPIALDDFSASEQILPDLNASVPTVDLFAKLEHLSTPIGLFADEGDGLLYLLRQDPEENGSRIRFTLTTIRPIPDEARVEELGTVTLPTAPTTKQLSLLFTPESVLAIEKSSVYRGVKSLGNGESKEVNRQDVHDLLIIPKALVNPTASPTSPLRLASNNQ